MPKVALCREQFDQELPFTQKQKIIMKFCKMDQEKVALWTLSIYMGTYMYACLFIFNRTIFFVVLFKLKHSFNY
jgi:hypothetical protein